MKKIYSIVGAAALLFLLSACGSVYVEEDPAVGLVDEEPVPALPPHDGSKVTVAVLPLGLTWRTARMYPDLRKDFVGMGVDKIVSEVLFDTGRFRFVEENAEILKDITKRQVSSNKGFTSEEQAIAYGRMLGARRVIYGEVFEYARGGEDISAFNNRQGFRTVVGVQIAYTDVETGEKLSLGTGRAFGATLMEATEKAVKKAVYRMIERLEDRHAEQ